MTRSAGLVLMLAAGIASAQGYLSGPALNKKIVSDFYRLVFEPRNVELIDRYVAADFVDHNPSVSGRDGLVKVIKALPPASSDDVGTEMKNPPLHIVAEGDLVTFIFKQSDGLTFDLFRVRGGKIAEHWDGGIPVFSVR